MNFFEEVAHAARKCQDSTVRQLVLGWHASFTVADDGRWGIGCVPDPAKEPHKSRESHTDLLTDATLVGLAGLLASPFPQEFAAATAACAALFPFPAGGLSLDAVMPCARGDRVAVLGYERELLPLMRDWGWKPAIFDDFRNGPDCFPQEDFSEGVRGADWVWLTPEAIRDRWLISMSEALREKKGCFLQGPGIPCLKESYAKLGVTHLVVPRATDNLENVRFRLAAGGDPWLCRGLEWSVYGTRWRAPDAEGIS